MSTLILNTDACRAPGFVTANISATVWPSLTAALNFSLVLGLHAWLILCVLHATGLIAIAPVPMRLMTVMISAPVKPGAPAPKLVASLSKLTPPARAAMPTGATVPGTASASAAPSAAASEPVPTHAAEPAASASHAPAQPETHSEARYDADYLNNPAPAYPLISRRQGESGQVLVLVQVTPQGAAAQVELRQSCGFPRLDQAALEAVRKWRFVPARRGEVAIAASVLVPLTFKLNV